MRAGRRGLALGAAAIGLGLAAPGCADVLGIPSGRELEATATAKTCVVPDDCKDIDFQTCSRSAGQRGTCVSLKSTECVDVDGDYRNPNAVYLGLLGPLSGDSVSTGRSTQDGVLMAIDEIRTRRGGVPPAPGTTEVRPIVLISCDDAVEPIRAAQHLADVIGVPAIVGPSFSGVTLKVSEVTIPRGVLLITGSATSVDITKLPDNGLVWRTAPPDTYQAQMFVQLFPSIMADLRTRYGLPAGDAEKVALIYKGDSAGQGLADDIEKINGGLQINGKPVVDPSNRDNYFSLDNGQAEGQDPQKPPRYDEAIAGILALRPHVVLGMITAEVIKNIMLPVEQQWGEFAYRPRWIYNDGVVVNELWNSIGSDDDLRQRVLLGRPGTTGDRFLDFSSDYRSRRLHDESSPEVLGAATAYDALYMLAYAISTLGTSPTGAQIATAFASLVDPASEHVDTGPSGIGAAFSALAAGQTINLDGASGPLDLDLTTGEGASDIQLLCVPKGSSGAATDAIASGLYLDAAKLSLAGEFKPAVCSYDLPLLPAPPEETPARTRP